MKIRKDYISSAVRCHSCGRVLRTSVAYVIESLADGFTWYAGKECAKKMLPKGGSINDIPDFTRHVLRNEAGKRGRKGPGFLRERQGFDSRFAAEYILLREVKLKEMGLNVCYQILYDLHQVMRERELNSDEVALVIKVESRAPTKLKWHSLQKLYTHLYWIDVAISNGTDKEKNYFSQKKRRLLSKQEAFSKNELAGINKWLNHIDGIPLLK